MKLRSSEVGVLVLKKVVESLNDLAVHVNINCSDDGLSVQAADPSLNVVVAMLLRAELFDRYELKRDVCMGVSLPSMTKVLKSVKTDDIINMTADDIQPDNIFFEIERPKPAQPLQVEMGLMDIDVDHLDIHKFSYSAVVRMSSAEFAKICSDLTNFGDTVMISVTENGIKFSSSNTIGSANFTYRCNTLNGKNEKVTIVNMSERVSMPFSLKFLNSFTKVAPLADTVTISLESGHPIEVGYEIPKRGYIKFFLVPYEEKDELEYD